MWQVQMTASLQPIVLKRSTQDACSSIDVGLLDIAMPDLISLHTCPCLHREIVLDAASDDFFARHTYSNYGDVGLSVKELVDKFAATSERHKAVSTLEDMQRFMLEHTDFTRAQTNVSKHVAVMSELSERVSGRNLMELSMVGGWGLCVAMRTGCVCQRHAVVNCEHKAVSTSEDMHRVFSCGT